MKGLGKVSRAGWVVDSVSGRPARLAVKIEIIVSFWAFNRIMRKAVAKKLNAHVLCGPAVKA